MYLCVLGFLLQTAVISHHVHLHKTFLLLLIHLYSLPAKSFFSSVCCQSTSTFTFFPASPLEPSISISFTPFAVFIDSAVLNLDVPSICLQLRPSSAQHFEFSTRMPSPHFCSVESLVLPASSYHRVTLRFAAQALPLSKPVCSIRRPAFKRKTQKRNSHTKNKTEMDLR